MVGIDNKTERRPGTSGSGEEGARDERLLRDHRFQAFDAK